MSDEDHFAGPQNSECDSFQSLRSLNFCCPEIEEFRHSAESAHHQIDQVFCPVDAPVSGDLCRCFLQGLSVLLSLDLLASQAFVASMTSAAFCHAGFRPLDRRRNSLTGSWAAQVVQMLVAWHIGVMNVSRLRAAVPGLQKWDGPSQKT